MKTHRALRTHRVTVRLTGAEYALLRGLARLAGETMAGYLVRKAALGRKVRRDGRGSSSPKYLEES